MDRTWAFHRGDAHSCRWGEAVHGSRHELKVAVVADLELLGVDVALLGSEEFVISRRPSRHSDRETRSHGRRRRASGIVCRAWFVVGIVIVRAWVYCGITERERARCCSVVYCIVQYFSLDTLRYRAGE